MAFEDTDLETLQRQRRNEAALTDNQRRELQVLEHAKSVSEREKADAQAAALRER